MDCITDALSFFRQSCGRWRSQRSQHHLLHRRAEAGASLVEVAMVDADDPRLTALAELHKMDPAAVVGGCHVRCSGSMAWDRAGENTVYAQEHQQHYSLQDYQYLEQLIHSAPS